MDEEIIYKEIPWAEGYKVGIDGSLWGCRKSGGGYGTFKEWRRLKYDKPGSNGRIIVGINANKIRHSIQLHRLILEVFVGKCPEGLIACHNNGIPTDCRLSNLRWDTYKSNKMDEKLHGTFICGEKHSLAKLTTEQVIQIKKDLLNKVKKPTELSRIYNVDISLICRIRDGKAWPQVKIYL